MDSAHFQSKIITDYAGYPYLNSAADCGNVAMYRTNDDSQGLTEWTFNRVDEPDVYTIKLTHGYRVDNNCPDKWLSGDNYDGNNINIRMAQYDDGNGL